MVYTGHDRSINPKNISEAEISLCHTPNQNHEKSMASSSSPTMQTTFRSSIQGTLITPSSSFSLHFPNYPSLSHTHYPFPKPQFSSILFLISSIEYHTNID
ncbi:hypothetical protein Hanom_Chr09g00865181 [Helianthus anomalus]